MTSAEPQENQTGTPRCHATRHPVNRIPHDARGPLCAEPAWIEERARRDEIADGAEHDVEEGR